MPDSRYRYKLVIDEVFEVKRAGEKTVKTSLKNLDLA